MLEFFKCGRELRKEDVRKNKYIMNAYQKGLKNYRIMTIGDIVRENWKPDKDIERYIVEYINQEGEVLLIANPVLKSIPQIQIRTIEEKSDNKFMVRGKQASVPYGLGMMDSDFTYGDWIILVEGIADREALLDIYPNVVAMLTDGISTIQMELIKNLTDRFMIIYDNDEVGKNGFFRDRKKLKSIGKEVKGFHYPQGETVGDPGDILQLKFEGKTFEADNIKEYFRSYINSVVS